MLAFLSTTQNEVNPNNRLWFLRSVDCNMSVYISTLFTSLCVDLFGTLTIFSQVSSNLDNDGPVSENYYAEWNEIHHCDRQPAISSLDFGHPNCCALMENGEMWMSLLSKDDALQNCIDHCKDYFV